MWPMTLMAFAAEVPDLEVAEEVIVYADPLSPWDETRWWMIAEVRSPEPLVLAVGGEAVPVYQWQVEAVIQCRIQKRRTVGGLVGCRPEDVSIRVATGNLWQRPDDLSKVQRVLDRVAADVQSSEVSLRVRGVGDLGVRADQREQAATQGAALLKTLYHAFDLQLPETGFRDGAVWTTTNVPLFDAHFGLERREEGVHYANWYRGEALIQSKALARREVLATMADPYDEAMHRFDVESQQQDENPGKYSSFEIPIVEDVTMDGVAIIDLDKGFVTERVWTIQGEDSGYYAAGRFRQLGDDEKVEMAPSAQRSPPRILRPGLPAWRSIDHPRVGAPVAD